MTDRHNENGNQRSKKFSWFVEEVGGEKKYFLSFHIDYLSVTGRSSKSFQSNSLYVTWIITKPKVESNYKLRNVKAKSKEMGRTKLRLYDATAFLLLLKVSIEKVHYVASLATDKTYR